MPTGEDMSVDNWRVRYEQLDRETARLRTERNAARALIRVGSTPQDLHERIGAAELECGLWVDAVERLRRMEVEND